MKKIIILFSMLLLVFFAGCSENEIEKTEETNKPLTKHLVSIRCESNDGELLAEYSMNYGETENIESVEITEYNGHDYEQKTVLTYNDQGHLQKKRVSLFEQDNYDEITHIYDEQGRLTRTQWKYSGSDFRDDIAYYIDYYYDENDKLTLEVLLSAEAKQVDINNYCSYEYNEHGQLDGKYEYISVSNYNHILTEYAYDGNGLLQEEKAECFEDLMCEPVGYFLTTYSYDAEGRVAQKSYTESVYGGHGGTWDTFYDYTYKNIQLSAVSGTEMYTGVTALHDLSGETLFTINLAANPIILQENGDLLRIESKDKNLIFVYEE